MDTQDQQEQIKTKLRLYRQQQEVIDSIIYSVEKMDKQAKDKIIKKLENNNISVNLKK